MRRTSRWARLGIGAAIAAIALLAVACEDDDAVPEDVDAPTVLPTSIAQRPGAPRDVGSAFPSTATPPSALTLRSDIESEVPALEGNVTDVRIELDRVMLDTSLGAGDAGVAQQACDEVLDVESLRTYEQVAINDESGALIANCRR